MLKLRNNKSGAVILLNRPITFCLCLDIGQVRYIALSEMVNTPSGRSERLVNQNRPIHTHDSMQDKNSWID
jgi:hypothetical protein